MEEFLFFILFALTTGSFMYILTCTDTNSNSPLALIKRFTFKHTPRLLKILFGQRIFNILKQVNDYFFYTNHSLVQILYVLVTGGGYATYLLYGLIPHFGNNPQVSHIHSVCGSALFLYCGYSYYQACTYKPGQITQSNQKVVVDEFKEYYDGILYKPSVECTTCKIIKPARSKHCRACNICVSKFDHHCIWIKQCVGQNNYKYFLKFIFVHALLCDYGCTVGVLCLHGIAQQQQLYTATYKNIYTNEMYKASFYQVSRHLFTKQPFLVFAVLLCALMGLSLTIFAIYHLSMIRYDRTTNERVKRSDFKSLYYKEMRQLQMIIKERPDSYRKGTPD